MNARSHSLDALLAWERGGALADEILHRALEQSHAAPLDRALFTELFYGTLRQMRRLDFLIDELAARPLDTRTRAVLRLGFYQIFETRIPEHAAVHETVELAGRARPLVNALLRRCLREKSQLEAKLAAASPDVRFSHPPHLIERWIRAFGEAETEALAAWNNEPPPIYVTANALKVTAGELAKSSLGAVPTAHPHSLRVRQIPFPWIASGLCYVQDPSTLIAPLLLDPQPGDRVLDACAAPGGKTAFMAGLMGDQGSIAACDVSEVRLRRLAQNLDRLGVTSATRHLVDWERPGEEWGAQTFDRILVDAPCTNTGVIRRRVDVRWRLRASDFPTMAERQGALVRNIWPLLRAGGRLVYSTCSLEPEENEGVIAGLSAALPDLRLVEERRTHPVRDGIDGSYAALLEKTS